MYMLVFRVGAFKNTAHCEIFFLRSVNHPLTSILIFAAYVYCTSRADARQDFPSLTPIINHRSVISRDLCSFGRTNFPLNQGRRKRKRSDRHFDPNTEAARNLCQIEKANLTERYGREIYVRRRNECKDTGAAG